jgi:hypothetical protein
MNFSEARAISKKYKDYPVGSWAQLFREVAKKLEVDDEEYQPEKTEETVQEYETKVRE